MSSTQHNLVEHQSPTTTTFKTTPDSSASSTDSKLTVGETLIHTPSSSSQDQDNTTTPLMADNVEATAANEGVHTPESNSSKSKEIEPKNPDQSSSISEVKVKDKEATGAKSKKARHKSHKKDSKKKSKKRLKEVDYSSTDDSSSSDSSSSSSSSSSSEEGDETSSDEDEGARKKRKARAKKAKKLKEKKKAKARKAKAEDTDSDSDSDDESSSSEDEKEKSKKKKRLKAKRRTKKSKKVEESDGDEDEEVDEDPVSQFKAQINALAMTKRTGVGGETPGTASKTPKKGKKKVGKKGSKVDFVRVDRVWDSSRHNYVLKATAEDPDVGEYDQYIFQVRRKFDWENRYQNTVLDIKSKALKEALKDVMKDVKGVSFAEDTPIIDPNMIFLYLEEIRAHMRRLKKIGKTEKTEKKRKTKTKKAKIPAATKAKHTKVLVKYLDKDYVDIKKTLYPLLESNKITYDLLWALYKSNEIAYCPTYSNPDEPRAFKIEYANQHSSYVKGKWYNVEGRYLEYDGKNFGMGSMEIEVPEFKGPRNISSLACYPLRYHKDAEKLKEQLVERGKKFVSLKGMQYRFHKGMAFYKRKRQIVKVNINGRVMVDPAIHRRINPNYPISTVKAADPDIMDDSDDESEQSSCCGSSSDEEGTGQKAGDQFGELDKPITKWKVIKDDDDEYQVVRVEIDGDGNVIQKEDIDELPGQEETKEREFTEEEFLIASPVVLGFAFNEKLWLELTVSGINHIEWNEGAYDSLVLPDNQKSIVKALVRSHTFEGGRNIDDVIQGKGRGLVAVMHGPPGTGKTLTAEGIAELLKRPLYMVSVGELGTNPHQLETELNKILDVAHSWGAVLLLDEADVFLEARQTQDIARNALVSIFLRLLEYFQGILFLTTNRVQTFDPAFQSRIHVALRYGELTNKAKKSVWKAFIEKVVAIEGVEVEKFSDEDYERLSRRNLNGRQIKNSVRTAQALAIDEKKPLSLKHVVTVLDVAETFEQDLKGGTGYTDAMRSYH